MKSVFRWVWNTGIVGTFLAGLFVLLPIVITVGICAWVGNLLASFLGTDTLVGRGLKAIGFGVSDNDSPFLAYLFGWVVVLMTIWLIGLVVRTFARQRIENTVHGGLNRVPIINTIYKPVSQVVGMLKGDENQDIRSMKVIFCTFGLGEGGGFLALQASPEVYNFAKQDCYAIYIPTSPVPMSGGIVFVPTSSVHSVEMTVDDLMKIYFSAGVLSSQVIDDAHKTGTKD
ncbi:MAG: DUF502 domain-containing protein [Pirellulales bacterium]|nr:DUF502 domain-containing protein [Pirellulales bacterium]